jgi:uncharacterized protein (DUF58 family)
MAAEQQQVAEFLASVSGELRRIELHTKRRVSADLTGKYRSAFRGSGLLFSDIREYQPGDYVKNIHWKVTARTGKVYVKSYEEDRQLSIMLAVDISRSTDFGANRSKHRKAIEFAALVSLLASQNRDSFGLCLFSDKVTSFTRPSASRRQFQKLLLELISEHELRPATDIGAALDYLVEHQRKTSVIFVVSDFLSPDFDESFRRLAIRHDVIAVLVEDDIDYELPAAGIVEFEDAESGKRYILDTSHPGSRAIFEQQSKERAAKLRAKLQVLGVDLMVLKDNPLSPLSELMTRRQARFR